MKKILFYDIETAGVNALNSDLGFVIIFGYKWADNDRARSLVIRKKDLRNFDDKRLLKEVSGIISKADITVTHYGSVFDRRFINGRLLINGLPAVDHTVMRDTKFAFGRTAKFSSNRLKHLAKILNAKHQKLENNWPVAWFRVMQGDMEALRKLAVYCEGDVMALEEMYYKVAPFVKAWKEKE